MVQFVKRPTDNREFAVKFFLDETAFHTESSYYAKRVPQLRKFVATRFTETVSADDAYQTAYGLVLPGVIVYAEFLGTRAEECSLKVQTVFSLSPAVVESCLMLRAMPEHT